MIQISDFLTDTLNTQGGVELFMEHISYLYYHGVLKNLHQRLKEEDNNKESLNRAIESVNRRIKEYETKPERYKLKRFLQETYDTYQNYAGMQ